MGSYTIVKPYRCLHTVVYSLANLHINCECMGAGAYEQPGRAEGASNSALYSVERHLNLERLRHFPYMDLFSSGTSNSQRQPSSPAIPCSSA